MEEIQRKPIHEANACVPKTWFKYNFLHHTLEGLFSRIKFPPIYVLAKQYQKLAEVINGQSHIPEYITET